MSDTEINIAIAEARGWQRKEVWDDVVNGREAWTLNGRVVYTNELPNYCHDLNAMREAEERFDGNVGASDYEITLRAVIVRHSFIRLAPGADPVVGNFRLLHATARQRAEAFLRTIGRWKE